MSPAENTAEAPEQTRQPERAAHALYLLLLLGLPTGISLLVALVWAHRARPHFAASWLETHRSWQLQNAWGFIIALALALWLKAEHENLALLLLLASALNFLDSVLRGWLALDDGAPITAQHPRTLLRRLLGEWRLQAIATFKRARQSRYWSLLRDSAIKTARLIWHTLRHLAQKIQRARKAR